MIIFFIVSYFCARITKPRKLIKPSGDIILFHHLLDSVDAFKDGDITCKYFTILPNWLKKKGVKVFALPWLGKNRTSINFYKKLRNTQSFVPEDWLFRWIIGKVFFFLRMSAPTDFPVSVESPQIPK